MMSIWKEKICESAIRLNIAEDALQETKDKVKERLDEVMGLFIADFHKPRGKDV